MKKQCLYCGKEILNSFGGKKFCNNEHQQRWYYINKQKSLKQQTSCSTHGKQSNRYKYCPYCGELLVKTVISDIGHKMPKHYLE